MQRMAGDLEWFDAHMKDGFEEWVGLCGKGYVGKILRETAGEWNEMHEMVQSEQVSGGRGNLMEMLKTSRIPIITSNVVTLFEEYAESDSLGKSFYYFMDATKAVWLRQRDSAPPAEIGPLEEEVNHDWAMVNIDRVVLESNKDKLSMFPFLADVPLAGGMEYHMLEIIASHVISMFQRKYIKAWIADHEADIDAKPYRLHTPNDILARIVAILDAESKKSD